MQMKKPIVWICKEQSRGSGNIMDFTPAMAYGEIQFITRSDLPLYPDSGIRMKWHGDVDDFVAKYDPSCDLIVTTGQPTSIFAIGHALGKAGKAPRYLVWRREDNRYRVFESSSQ
jgi:hypothetical protein